MGGCAKNGKDGTDGKEDAAVALGLSRLGLSRKMLAPLRLYRSGRRFVKITLWDPVPPDKTTRQQSARYWKGLLKDGTADTLITAKNKITTIVLSVPSQSRARKIIQADPIVAAGGVKKIDYETLRV
jgi:hypothetical protein